MTTPSRAAVGPASWRCKSGDPETLRLWHVLVNESIAYFSAVYAKLDVTLSARTSWASRTTTRCSPTSCAISTRRGLLVESDGALCVFPPGFVNRDGEPLPLIMQKRDEGYGYAATDLAALRDRVSDLHSDELLYVVGAPQVQHFEMVFAVAREAGWLPDTVRCEHVVFGNVLGKDHKMFKSRDGETVKLVTLIDEAIERAYVMLDERGTDLDGDAKFQLAEQIARAAIKYADLSTERQHDYVFDLDRMIAFEGDTGPYLQYAHARLRSIFRRSGEVLSPARRTSPSAPSPSANSRSVCSRCPRRSPPRLPRSSLTGSAPISLIWPSDSRRSTTLARCCRPRGRCARSASRCAT